MAVLVLKLSLLFVPSILFVSIYVGFEKAEEERMDERRWGKEKGDDLLPVVG
jgi:hypothetical protein